MNNNNSCVENSKLWHTLLKMRRANNNKSIILTSEQRSALCNFVNGKPFNKKILRSIFQK